MSLNHRVKDAEITQFTTKMVTASRNKKRLRQCANTVNPEPDH